MPSKQVLRKGTYTKLTIISVENEIMILEEIALQEH